MEWAEDHTHAQTVARRLGVPQAQVEGDNFGVPGIQDLIDLIAAKVEAKPDPRAASFGAAMWKYITKLGGDFCFAEISEDILPLAQAAGLCGRVKYDPEIHGDGIEAEPGDEIWWWGGPQGVQPVDFSALFGAGQAEDWEGFEEAVELWRSDDGNISIVATAPENIRPPLTQLTPQPPTAGASDRVDTLKVQP